MKVSSVLAPCLMLVSLLPVAVFAQTRTVTFVNDLNVRMRVHVFARPCVGSKYVAQVDVLSRSQKAGTVHQCVNARGPGDLTIAVTSEACVTQPQEQRIGDSTRVVRVKPPKRHNPYPPHPCDIEY